MMDQSVDSNNNTEVKYSLRPRAAPRRALEDGEETKKGTGSRKKRMQRSPPLSRHRRRSANARERSRMREINEAFEALRAVVTGGEGPEKTTKISTLRLAIRYISALTEAVRDPGVGRDPGVLQESTTTSNRTVSVGIESSIDCLGCSSSLLGNVGKNLQPQKETPLTLSNYLLENPDFLPSSSGGLCENDLIVSNFEVSSPRFQNCSVNLDCQQQEIINISHAESDITSTLIPDLKTATGIKSNLGNYLLCDLQSGIHNQQDSSEILAGVNTATLSSMKRCVVNSISSDVPHTVYFGHDDQYKTAVEFPQIEECSTFLPLKD